MQRLTDSLELAYRVLARLVGWDIIGPIVCLQVQVKCPNAL